MKKFGILFLLLALCLCVPAPRAWAQPADPPPEPPETIGTPTTPKARHELRLEENDVVINHSRPHEVFMYDRDVTVKKGERARNVVVITGNATVDGEVEHDVVVINGTATVNGHIREGLVVVAGDAVLGPKARIDRHATVVGGVLKAEEGAQVRERQEIPLGPGVGVLQGGFSWLTKGVMLARPLPPQVGWVWVVAGIFFLINVLMATMFPQPAAASVATLTQKPVASFFTGMVTIVLFLPFLILLIVSVVGILAIPLVICGLVGAVVFGKMVVYRYAGQQFSSQLGFGSLGTPLLALGIGTLMFYLLYAVPVIGLLVWLAATVLGLGTVLLSALQSYRAASEASARAAAAAMPTPGVYPGMTTDATGAPVPGAALPEALA
ncbi:MAG TPA: polymer-forming cytoskeletal protein, partial [Verrucomicrobiae bacterium]|nr:polymer-forming cytoskeletal protein [Verrucomicrobiae bacterium]